MIHPCPSDHVTTCVYAVKALRRRAVMVGAGNAARVRALATGNDVDGVVSDDDMVIVKT